MSTFATVSEMPWNNKQELNNKYIDIYKNVDTNHSAIFNGRQALKTTVTGLSGTGEKSISVWAKTNSYAGTQYIYTIGKNKTTFEESGGLFGLFLNKGYKENSGLLGFDGNNLNYNIGPISINDNWYHYVVTFKNTNLKIYVNSTLVGSGVRALDTTTNDLVLGAKNSISFPSFIPQNQFIGEIDGFEAFNYELSQSEITNLFNNGAGIQTPLSATGLIASIHFNNQIAKNRVTDITLQSIGSVNPTFKENNICIDNMDYYKIHGIPYIFAKPHCKRIVLYKDLIINDNEFENFEINSVLAPQKTTGNLPSPQIRPFKTLNWDVSQGYLNMPLETATASLTSKVTGVSFISGYYPIATSTDISGKYYAQYPYVYQEYTYKDELSANVPLSSYIISSIYVTSYIPDVTVYTYNLTLTSISSYNVTDDTQGYWCTGGNLKFNITPESIFEDVKNIGPTTYVPVSNLNLKTTKPFDLILNTQTFKGYQRNIKTGKFYRSRKPLFISKDLDWSGGVKITPLDTSDLIITEPTIKELRLNIENRTDSEIRVTGLSASYGSDLITVSSIQLGKKLLTYNIKHISATQIPSNSSTYITLSTFNWIGDYNFTVKTPYQLLVKIEGEDHPYEQKVYKVYNNKQTIDYRGMLAAVFPSQNYPVPTLLNSLVLINRVKMLIALGFC